MHDHAKRRAVFIDRDGTINEEVNYLGRPEDARLLPGVAQAMASLSRAGLAVVVVSNQSGLARGYFCDDDLRAVRFELAAQLARQGARVDGWYHCPHHPEGVVAHLAVECDCRKPAPGLILRAAKELGLELDGSFMIGDRLRDVACGKAVGLGCVLVRSGQDDGPPTGPHETPDFVADDLAQAARWILERLAEDQA